VLRAAATITATMVPTANTPMIATAMKMDRRRIGVPLPEGRQHTSSLLKMTLHTGQKFLRAQRIRYAIRTPAVPAHGMPPGTSLAFPASPSAPHIPCGTLRGRLSAPSSGADRMGSQATDATRCNTNFIAALRRLLFLESLMPARAELADGECCHRLWHMLR
jgi:hypothetical protein